MNRYLISDLSLRVTKGEELEPRGFIADALAVDISRIKNAVIVKRSIDARKKPEVFWVYSIAVTIDEKDKELYKRLNRKFSVSPYRPKLYSFENPKKIKGSSEGGRPVVIGAGPAGIFCAYLLAVNGLRPIVIERGKPAGERLADVKAFWETGVLSPDSNASFGEGGAGTFSDGKLNTLNKDKYGRIGFILRTFVKFGADESVLYDNKPHIGTDKLVDILPAIREDIIKMGGEYRFNTKVTGLDTKNGRLAGVRLSNGETMECREAVLAIGHSARDTYRWLYDMGIPMEAKAFAVGFRIEHPQSMINISQYGREAADILAPASYKLVSHHNDRGVYSFCMCPGGYVVDSSTEDGGLVVNGMSYSQRSGANANSAIVISADEKDFGGNDPMSAIAFQRKLEERAFKLCDGAIPQQLLGDYIRGTVSLSYGDFPSAHKGRVGFANMRGLLPQALEEAYFLAICEYAKKIHGFDRYDAIMSGVESRTSSPVRIIRDEGAESVIRGLYPCGEGAGYAGGITSAAADGLKCAEEIIKKRLDDE